MTLDGENIGEWSVNYQWVFVDLLSPFAMFSVIKVLFLKCSIVSLTSFLFVCVFSYYGLLQVSLYLSWCLMPFK